MNIRNGDFDKVLERLKQFYFTHQKYLVKDD
jgi:hypothetical protein